MMRGAAPQTEGRQGSQRRLEKGGRYLGVPRNRDFAAPRDGSECAAIAIQSSLSVQETGCGTGLIFAGIGASLTLEGQPLLSPESFSALVLMVVITTLLAPIGLRWALPPAKPAKRS
jgi:hypothetical protein